MGRTGSVDRCCVFLVRALHLFFERREARGLGGSPAQGVAIKAQAEVFFKEECARTWTSSGSGVGRDWIRYSICLAFTMRSSTSSFWFAFFSRPCV